MFYSRPADIPLAHLPNLLELEVAFTDTYDGLGEAVRQAPQLQSLCLFWITHEVDEVIHEVVAAISHLPNLAMLAIQHGTTYTPIPAAACAQFCAALRGRARLRRLFCNLRIRHDDCAAHLDMLATLPNLEILALVTEDVLCVEFLAELQRCLPAQLSVLMLSHTYADSHGPQAFLRFWQHFSNLSFLRVEAWAAPGLTAHDIVHHAGKSLQLVQYRGDVLDVEHWEDGQTMLWPWSTQKILLRGIEDSGCEGWNWYMRHSLA
ncbi:hypothetical protein EVJ58_g7774 [Rhodofomes roseus]|nr:hypothetical protein EVJ58_g7774 [Rhodofomes roseus]